MVRPRRCRRVWCEPDITYFKPSGIRVRDTEIINLTVDEFEAIRLVDNENMEQIKAAEKMDISQPTLHRLLHSAHNKIAEAICKGKAIKIKGGEYMVYGRGQGMGPGRGAGAGRGRGIGRGGAGMDKEYGSHNTCKCPKCGEIVPHSRGIPCMQQKCPKCGTNMVPADLL